MLWAGLIDEAKRYVLWYAKRIYPNGLVPPILNVDGTVNRGYGSDIEYDPQGEFVGIAAEVYRITRDRAFLDAIFEPVVRATRFIEELCARTNAPHGPATASMASSRRRSATRAIASRPSAIGTIIRLERLAQLRISRARNRRSERPRRKPRRRARHSPPASPARSA